MACVRSTVIVDERIDAVILALDGCGWMTQRELADKMTCMVLVENYQIAHLTYTLQKLRLKGLIECRRVRGSMAYEYRLKIGP
jgi:predicted metalloprotease